MAQLKTEYESVMRFVVQERLHWGDGSDAADLAPKGRPFEVDGNSPAYLEYPLAKQDPG